MAIDRDDLIRRLRTTKRASVKTSKVNWNKLIRDPRDVAQLQAERDARLHAARYSEAADERDGRICAIKDGVGTVVLDIGFDNNRSNPTRQAIVYNRVTHLWDHASSVVSYSKPVTQLSNMVTNDTARSINLHKGGSL